MPKSFLVQARDPKGLYAKVAKGIIKNFTGVDAPYEMPFKPEVILKTHEMSVDSCVELLVEELRRRGFLSGSPDAASTPREILATFAQMALGGDRFRGDFTTSEAPLGAEGQLC